MGGGLGARCREGGRVWCGVVRDGDKETLQCKAGTQPLHGWENGLLLACGKVLAQQPAAPSSSPALVYATACAGFTGNKLTRQQSVAHALGHDHKSDSYPSQQVPLLVVGRAVWRVVMAQRAQHGGRIGVQLRYRVKDHVR